MTPYKYLHFIGLSYLLNIDILVLIVWSILISDKKYTNAITRLVGWPLVKQLIDCYPKPLPHIHLYETRTTTDIQSQEIKQISWIITTVDTIKAPNMTVKRPIVNYQLNNGQTNLALLAQYIQLFNEHPEYIPKEQRSLMMWSKAIVTCLAQADVVADGIFIADLHSQVLLIQRFVEKLVENNENDPAKDALLIHIISTFYRIISDPDEEASPIAAIILTFVPQNFKLWQWHHEHDIRNNSDGSLRIDDLTCERAIFSTFCRWLWQTPWISHAIIISEWVMYWIHQLQASRRYEILINVSLDSLELLFLRLDYATFRQNIFPVVYHILVSMRDTNLAFDKISQVALQVLENLAIDGIDTEVHLNPLLNIFAYIVKHNKKTAHEVKKQDYASVENFLKSFVISNEIPKTLTWKTDTDDEMSGYKAGLNNLGNTCYVNSVLQALFMTKQFSTEIVMNQMTNCPILISYLATIFSHMMYPRARFLNPTKLVEIILPPGFMLGRQQDSSEFLSHVLEEVHSLEREAVLENNKDIKLVTTTPDSNDTEKNNIDTMSSLCDVPKDPPVQETADTPVEVAPNTEEVNPMPSTSSAFVQISAASSSSDTISSSFVSSSTPSCSFSEDTLSDPEIPSSSNDEPSSSTACFTTFSPRRSYRFKGKSSLPNSVIGPSKKRRVLDDGKIAYNSIVQKAFSGVTMSEVQCLECTTQSTRLDTFRDLQLAFPDKTLGVTRVQDFLDFYWSPEKMFGDNKYHCVHCNKLCNAERRIYINVPPKNLIIVLKNFKYDAKLRKQTKILQPVYIDDSIILPTCQNKSIEYELYAAVIHSGQSTDAGHYYTVACDGSDWYEFDDNDVNVCDKNNLNKLKPPLTPYILFYRLVDSESHQFPRQNDIPAHVRRFVSFK